MLNTQLSPEIAELGMAIGQGLVQAQNQYKEASLTPGTVNIYGRQSIFSPCSPGDVFGLQVQTHGLMNWLGWRPNRFYNRRVDFITYFGPAGMSDDTHDTGATEPCDDPPGWEYGSCGYNLHHTSWYSRSGDPLGPHEITQDRCETTPRYRVNGTPITDDVEWQMNGMMGTLEMSIRRDIIHGSHANAREMNGLERLVKMGHIDDEGHACTSVDSILVDWASDDLDGTDNGLGNFFEYLDEVITEIEWRASSIGTIDENDMVLFVPRFMATALLDSFACYTTCGVTNSNGITDQALRAQQRAERRALNGGPLYDGRVAVGYLHLKSGRRLPIIVEDNINIGYNATDSTYCSDMYILTRRIGAQDVLYGEYLDLRTWENRIKAHMSDFRGKSDEAGRFGVKSKEDNFCVQAIIGTSPEIYLSAPWAQVRISDVCTSRGRKPLTGDPFQTQYLPEQNLYPAYVYDHGLSE